MHLRVIPFMCIVVLGCSRYEAPYPIFDSGTETGADTALDTGPDTSWDTGWDPGVDSSDTWDVMDARDSAEDVAVDPGPEPCGDAVCADGESCCGSACVDTDTDFDHCGACYSACNTDTANECTTGSCQCQGTPACSGGSWKCCTPDRCVDTDWDDMHCGDCGIECWFDEICEFGWCEYW